MDEFRFSHSQQSAIQSFEEFLNGPNQVFMLRGAAGTGKTTLLKEFVNILLSKNKYSCSQQILALLAPTGRAAHILREKTGCNSSTIHGHIYDFANLKSNNLSKDDEEDDTLHFSFALKDNDKDTNFVYFVDEASMVSDVRNENELFSFGSGFLLSDLFRYIGRRKIVFVGDYAQLAPVGMTLSPALDKKYIEEKFKCEVSEITLTEVFRQNNGSIILKNATEIRDKIEAKCFVEFKLKPGDNFINVSIDLLEPYYTLFKKAPSPHTAIVTHTNRLALKYNQFIREHYFGKDANRVKDGDLLLISRNNYHYCVELFNGTIVKVITAQPDSEIEKRTIKIKLGREKYKDVELQFRNATIAFKSNGKPVELSVKLLDNFITEPSANVEGDLTRAIVVDFNQRLSEDIKKHLYKIKNFLRGKDEKDSRIRELATTYSKLILTDPYYNAVICKYGYAMTCHKAQGGEWENIFVDMERYGGTSNEGYFRWAYTAVTRASKNLWYFRAPDFDYISDLTVPEIQFSKNVRIIIYGEGNDFTNLRFERIESLANEKGIVASQNKSKQSQQIITFTNKENQLCQIRMWYGKDGYKSIAGDIISASGNHEFDKNCMKIVRRSFAPEKIDISLESENRPFFIKLTQYMQDLTELYKIKIVNITHERYQDVFHLLSDGIAKVLFSHDEAGKYSYMKIISSMGQEDTKLVAFRREFL